MGYVPKGPRDWRPGDDPRSVYWGEPLGLTDSDGGAGPVVVGVLLVFVLMLLAFCAGYCAGMGA